MILLLAALLCPPDTVHGRIRDANGAPVSGAEIVVADIGRLAISNAAGEFTLDAPAHSTLVIRRTGYAALTRRVDQQGEIDIVLDVEPFAMEPINVTAARAPVVGGATLATAVLGREELQREAGVSIAHQLDDLPGVRTLSTGEQIGKPVIRGLFGSRVLVLEDALRLEDYSWSDEDAPSIDAAFADRIEVVRGPVSLLYGSDALGGVVNVIPAPLPQPGSDVHRTGVELTASSNRREGGLIGRAEGASNSLGWRALLVARFAEAYRTPRGEVENTGFATLNGEVAVGTQKPWGSLTGRVAHYGGEFKLLEMDAPAQQVPGEAEGGPVRKLFDDRLQIVGQFPINNARLETRAQYQRHWLQEVADLPGQAAQAGREVPVFDLLLSTISFDALLHHSAGRNMRGSIGASLITQSHDSRGPLVIVPDKSILNAAVSAVERLQTGALEWIAGARVDHHKVDDSKNAVSFNLGTIAKLSRAASLRFNAGRAWRAPNLFELFADGPRIGEARYEIGDRDLDPERSLELDAGLDIDSRAFHGEASVYSNHIRDFIVLQPTARLIQNLRVFAHQQVDAQVRGVELLGELKPTRSLRMVGEFDAVEGTDTDHDTPLPWMPAPRLQSHVELSRAFAAFTHAYARAGMEHTWAKTRTAANEPTDVKPYTLFTAGFGGETSFHGKKTRIDVGLRNITNVEYRDFLSRYRDFALNPGRDINIRLSVDF